MLNLIQHVSGRAWAIRAEIAANVHALVRKEGLAGLRHLAELKATVHAFDGGRGRRRGGTKETIGVVPIIGVLTHRGDVIHSMETRSTAAIADEVQVLAGDDTVGSLLLEVDSPGGEASFVAEAWQAIFAAAKVKPVVAVANTQMASAALFLASAATELWITQSGEAGSLGVYALHIDESKAMEQEGISAEFIVADDSPFKVEGNSLGPLSDDGRAQMKKLVNRHYSLFARDVARGRGVSVEHVRQRFGRGRMLGPEEAVAVRMADRVGSIDQALGRAAQLGREWRESGPSARAERPAAAHVAAAPPRTVSLGPGCSYTADEFLAMVDRMHEEARRTGKL